jgi:hypothetical protein
MRQYATFLIPTICFTFHLSSDTGFADILLTASDKLFPVFPSTRLHFGLYFGLYFDMHSDFEQMLTSFSALMIVLALLLKPACSNSQEFDENKKNDKKKKHGIRTICGLDDNLPRFCHGA